MTFAIFHDFPVLENDLPKFHDFPWPGGTLNCVKDGMMSSSLSQEDAQLNGEGYSRGQLDNPGSPKNC